jgi:hypothetical protein
MGTMEMSVEQFLEHEARARGGSYLKNWKDPKKGGKGFIHVWLHRKCAFSVALWRHGVPRVDIFEDPKTNDARRVVFTGNELCPEDEKVLQKQNWRDRESGERQLPPESCPICLLVEHVHQLIKRGELSITQKIFVFEPGDGKDLTIHAGGMCGLFNDKLSDGDKNLLKAAGVWLTDAWKENFQPRLNYVFRVVDHDAPGQGVQIAIEPNLLGDKMKAEIRKAMMPGVKGPDLGNPIKNPVAFRWEAHPEQSELQKRYDVVRLDGMQATPEIVKLITETEPPTIDGLTRSPTWATVRAQLERATQVDLPWDDFFGTEVTNEDKKEGSRARTPEVGKPAASQAPEVEMVACDNDECEWGVKLCGGVARLPVTAPVCPKCGRVYEIVAAAPPPPPPMRKRGDAKSAAQPVSKPMGKAPEPWMDKTNDNDPIPF